MRVSTRFTVIILLIAMGMSTLSLSTTNHAAAQGGQRYVLLGTGNSLPVGLEALVTAAGGRVLYQLDEIGVAVVESAEPAFEYAVAGIAGVQGVSPDRLIALAPPDQGDGVAVESLRAEAAPEGIATEAGSATPCMNPPVADCNPALAGFFPIQWNLRTIGVLPAWNAGYTGNRNIKVAVLDTGIDYTHQEFQRLLNGQIISIVDPVLSKSFFNEFDWPNTPLPLRLPPGFVPKDYADFSGHGTHIAGIIAAGGVRLAGIARDVTLIAVKVMDRRGVTDFGTVIPALKYAVDAGADIINMSIGEELTKADLKEDHLKQALLRAVNYAHSKGVLLVASAGNKGINWDAKEFKDLTKVPAQLSHVVAVSATGPQFWANMDGLGVTPMSGVPHAYTDYGRSIVNLAAPGGSITPFRVPPVPSGMPLDRVFSACSRFMLVSTVTVPVAFPCQGSVPTNGIPFRPFGIVNTFMIGTSMAAAHVSGVAALALSARGGTGAQIAQVLMLTADDRGDRGKDEFYGYGRINACRAVGAPDCK